MKVTAYYILHYGHEYINYSMRSIYNHVDEIIILYSEHPSHGTLTALRNPDSRESIKEQVYDVDNKVIWIDGIWRSESAHRRQAEHEARIRGADILLIADYDEIWTSQIGELLNLSWINNTYETKIYMNHLWKGFNLICKDGHRQGRIYNLRVTNKDKVCTILDDSPAVYHFGYAITDDLMRYKTAIHGHISEFREGWFENVWLGNKRRDVHPVCIDMWNPKEFNKNALPEIMNSHQRWL